MTDSYGLLFVASPIFSGRDVLDRTIAAQQALKRRRATLPTIGQFESSDPSFQDADLAGGAPAPRHTPAAAGDDSFGHFMRKTGNQEAHWRLK
jgi:hypothetical protein